MHTAEGHYRECGCDAGIVRQTLCGIWERALNSTGNNVINTIVYTLTAAGTFLTDNWYTILMVVFGGLHAFVAWRRHKRDEAEADYKRRDRALQAERDEKLFKIQEDRIKKELAQKEREALTEHNEKKRNRDHFNKRAELHCKNPEARRSSVRGL